MIDWDTRVGSRLSLFALCGLLLMGLVGCTGSRSGSSAYQRVQEGEGEQQFLSAVGCMASSQSASTSEEATSRRGPPTEIDACELIDGWGIPDRVDHLNIGGIYYQTWLYDRYTVIIRRDGCDGGDCEEGTSPWRVIYSG